MNSIKMIIENKIQEHKKNIIKIIVKYYRKIDLNITKIKEKAFYTTKKYFTKTIVN